MFCYKADVFLGRAPTMPELFLLTGRSGKQFRVLDRIAPYWEEFAFALHFEGHITESVKMSSMRQVSMYIPRHLTL